MDARRSFFWMLASGVLNVYKTAEMTRNMWPEAPNALFKVLYAELNTCIGMFLFWVAVEALAFDRVKVFLEATSSDTEKTIVSNLLSGFCDAQVQLGPDLQVIGEHDRLCRIVMADSLTLHGTSFANYLASPDVSRFQAFIDASSVQVGTETASRTTAAASTAEQQGSQVLKILPRVLHVHMRDFKGRLFDVTLFHTRLKTSEEEYRHIIGICEDTSQPRAEAAPAVAAANTNSDNNNNRNDKNKKSNKNDSNNSNKNKKSNNSSSNSNNNNHSNSSNSNSNLRLSSSNSNSNSNSNLRLRRRNNNNSTNNNDDDDGDNNNNNNTNTNNSSLGQATAIGQQAFLGSQERASSVKSQSSASTSGVNSLFDPGALGGLDDVILVVNPFAADSGFPVLSCKLNFTPAEGEARTRLTDFIPPTDFQRFRDIVQNAVNAQYTATAPNETELKNLRMSLQNATMVVDTAEVLEISLNQSADADSEASGSQPSDEEADEDDESEQDFTKVTVAVRLSGFTALREPNPSKPVSPPRNRTRAFKKEAANPVDRRFSSPAVRQLFFELKPRYHVHSGANVYRFRKADQGPHDFVCRSAALAEAVGAFRDKLRAGVGDMGYLGNIDYCRLLCLATVAWAQAEEANGFLLDFQVRLEAALALRRADELEAWTQKEQTLNRYYPTTHFI
ncbi:unnamed protein product [Polarella glacialis]|uniref:Uncharacterized protein n=1 Tax=Polarella glacialis TaxID=89957 RepID=A0A813D700_POLGL|nr:unnamed protein product [Polarella glacialis]